MVQAEGAGVGSGDAGERLPDVTGLAQVDVSIVVPAFNEEKYLPALLRSLARQRTSASFEVIVFDDRSTDRTAEIARSFGAQVFVNELDESGQKRLDVVGMRNEGVRRSRGRTVLIADADCAFSPRYLERMSRPILREGSEIDTTLATWQTPLERKTTVRPSPPYSWSYLMWLRWGPPGVVGRAPIRLGRWLGTWVREGFRRPLLEIGDRVRTGMLLVRREIFDAVGGQQGTFGGHVDSAFALACLRASRRVRWVLGVALYESARRDFPAGGIGWLFREPRRHLRRLLGRGAARTHVARDEGGYVDPAGRR